MSTLIGMVAELGIPDQVNQLSAYPPQLELGGDGWNYDEMPKWATEGHLSDRRRLCPWTSDQYVLPIGLGDAFVTTVVDTGTCKTMIDYRVAEACNLPIVRSN